MEKHRDQITAALPEDQNGFTLTPERIGAFLQSFQEKGRAKETVRIYQRNLELLYRYLPEDKRIERGTLRRWQDDMLAERYAVRTVNARIAAANSLLAFCERQELQLHDLLESPDDVQPELTRTEYLRLLSAARMLERERTYLLVKTFGTLGLTIQELPALTVEAAQAGRLVPEMQQVVRIPACFARELLDYAERQGIFRGEIFMSRSGKRLNRTYVTASIQALSSAAQVSREKCNPRCLRKLYQSTQAGIQANLSLLIEQAHERLLETEQLTIGWAAGG